jgi:hypothetical protein
MVSVPSENVTKCIDKAIKSTKIDVGRQHYQVIENRIESTEDDKIYIQRIDADTGDNKQTTIYSFNSKDHISNFEYQIYQQEVYVNRYYGRFIYCIGMEDTENDVKTVCIIVLNQTTSGDEVDGRPSFNYDAVMFYINIPLQKTTTGQPEQLLDEELKRYIMQTITECNSFQEFMKTVPFNSGRLWEIPIQFTGHKMVYLSIHEPLSKPSVLNIVLQKYDGTDVSYILCISLIFD